MGRVGPVPEKCLLVSKTVSSLRIPLRLWNPVALPRRTCVQSVPSVGRNDPLALDETFAHVAR